jgi:hypothetical protein
MTEQSQERQGPIALGAGVENELARSGIFAGVDLNRAQSFVKIYGRQLVDAFVNSVRAAFQDSAGRIVISVNYDADDAGEEQSPADLIKQLINEIGLAECGSTIEFYEIPALLSGTREWPVHEIQFLTEMRVGSLAPALVERGKLAGFPNGYEFCDFLTALNTALKLKEQEEIFKLPRAIVFNTSAPELCWLNFWSENGLNRMCIARINPDDKLDAEIRYLAVPAAV